MSSPIKAMSGIPVIMFVQLLELQKAETVGADASFRVGLLDAFDAVRDFLELCTIFVSGCLEEEARDG